MSALRAAFGQADQLQATRALETFFEFKRQRMTLPEWSVQWQLNLDEAMTHSGLELNNVAKTYLYFKSSGLNQKSLDDLLLQVHGDMRRFEEVRTLMLRMAHRNIDSGSNAAHYEEITTDDASSWSAVTDMWSSDADGSNYYMDELYAWYEDDGWYSQPQPWDYDYAETYYEEWPDYDYGWNDDEAPAAEDGEVQQDGNAEESKDYYKGKGRTPTMGLGCSTCGSKWHNTHACPMNDTYKGKTPMKGKGKSKGYGKGKGKSYGGRPYGGKSYGKKGFGKSKSYGKGGYGNRQGRKGFWLEDMPKNFNDYYGGAYLLSNISSPEKEDADKLDKVIIRDTFNEVEPLPTRRVRFSDAPEGDQADDTTAKKLNFPVTEEVGEMVFHQVRGRRVRGLLVDPGASSGLIGSETLRDLFDSGMVPPEKANEITWGAAQTTVTGISGQSDQTSARISIPFGIGAEDAEYTADIIGGDGSNCPALLPNGSLRQLRTTMTTQWYDNGDGVMICSLNGHRPDDPAANLVAMKLLLAESGHYILPVNKEDQDMSLNEQKEILAWWKGRSSKHTVAREQSDLNDNSGNYDIKSIDVADTENVPDSNAENPKLQFAADTEPKNDKFNNKMEMIKVADDEPEIQVLKSDNLEEEYNEAPQPYGGDQFPAHLKPSKLRYLSKLYKAIPEEFYTKTQRTPVTPRNARSWAKKRRGAHFHLWEMCSGSGRLSFLALCAGLSVMFPLDYRYGWDLGSPAHRRLIDEIEETFQPDVDFMSPSCRPWSISSVQRDLQQTQQEREEEMPVINYLKKKAKQQCQKKKGYIWEQPWSSAMWERLQENPGHADRTDQCRFGAQDEVGNPILKPTGLQSNLALKHCVKRCTGHLGQKHGWLQGAVQGVNRTTAAAVYPESESHCEGHQALHQQQVHSLQ